MGPFHGPCLLYPFFDSFTKYVFSPPFGPGIVLALGMYKILIVSVILDLCSLVEDIDVSHINIQTNALSQVLHVLQREGVVSGERV